MNKDIIRLKILEFQIERDETSNIVNNYCFNTYAERQVFILRVKVLDKLIERFTMELEQLK